MDVMKLQQGGDHYKGVPPGYQPIEIAETLGLSATEFSVLKYLLRYKKKNGLEDLKKMMHFGQMLIARHYGVQAEISYSDAVKPLGGDLPLQSVEEFFKGIPELIGASSLAHQPIPFGIYWSDVIDDFVYSDFKARCSSTFRDLWFHRRGEFPKDTVTMKAAPPEVLEVAADCVSELCVPEDDVNPF